MTIRSFLLPLFFSFGWLQLPLAQVSQNVDLLGHWHNDTLPHQGDRYYSDCWGFEKDGSEYAVMGSLAYVHFFEIADYTGDVTEIARFAGGSNTGWREFKTYADRLYAISDVGTEGLMIFDLSQLPDTIIKTYHATAYFQRAHMLFIDEAAGRLYITGSNTRTNGLIVLDISSNLDQPVLLASVDLPPGNYVHDVFVRDGIAYCSHGNNGLYVWDFKDPSQPILLASQVFNGYNHSSWMNKEGNLLVNAEEVPRGLPLLLLDISGAAAGQIETLNAFRYPLLAPGSADVTYHNPYILGDYVIVSAYEDGVQVFDIRDPSLPVHYGWYDTYPDNSTYTAYKGCWGVYPFLPSGRWIASDMQRGLFILQPHFLDSNEIRKETLRIWPNPATDLITVFLSTDQFAYYNYILFNAAGQVFRRGTLCAYGDSEQTLDISDIPPGLYGIRIEIAGDDPDFGFSGPIAEDGRKREETAFSLFLKYP